MSSKKPVVLCILDGWGLSEAPQGNAPKLAQTPNFDKIMQGPNATLLTHGNDAGLPRGQMGNSEVGHTNIGAGRVVAMDLGQIDLSIEENRFATEPAFTRFINTLKSTNGTAHLMGVMSDGGVHGHINHIVAAAKACDEAGIPTVLHLMSDGRDVAPSSAQIYLDTLLQALPKSVTIATLSGRYFAMDRDNRWERVETAYNAMVRAEGPKAAHAQQVIETSYAQGITDEFIPATVLGAYRGMRAQDGVFCLNFRSDRAREILEAIANPEFSGFARKHITLSAYLGMVDYSDAHKTWYETVFPKREIKNTLGSWVAQHGKRQFRLAETEKYPHVTFFFNGGVETPYPNEDRYMPASPKVATYDLQPEMSAKDVTDRFVQAIGEGYDLIITNYANPDMVGHTGDLQAAIEACEAVDEGLGRVLEALKAAGGTMIVTADHGNCEKMIDEATNGPHTAHTLNPVPVALVGKNAAQLRNGRLADLAPTLLELMDLAPPKDMTGHSLITT